MGGVSLLPNHTTVPHPCYPSICNDTNLVTNLCLHAWQLSSSVLQHAAVWSPAYIIGKLLLYHLLLVTKATALHPIGEDIKIG